VSLISAISLSVIILGAIILSVIILNIGKMSVAILSDIIPSVTILSSIMLNVTASKEFGHRKFQLLKILFSLAEQEKLFEVPIRIFSFKRGQKMEKKNDVSFFHFRSANSMWEATFTTHLR